MKLSNRVKNMSSSPTMAVMVRASELKRQGIDVIDLGPGEPDFNTPDHIKAAAYQAIEENFTKYTPASGIPELKAAVARRYEQAYHLPYTPQEVIITVGGKQALFNIALALFESGDEVILPSPYWVSYPEQIKLAGATLVILEMHEEDGFSLRPNDVEVLITPKTKAIIINSPCNPTGTVIEPEALEATVALARRHGFYVIYDECYERFIYDTDHTSVAEFGKENVIVVNTLSKTYAMTGWRIGFALASKELIAAMGRLQSQSTSNPTSISQWAALHALEDERSEAAIEEMIAEYHKRRDIIVQALNRIPGVSCLKPNGAFYAFPNVSSFLGSEIQSTVQLADYLLDKAQVAVVPGEAFGQSGYIRLSYATSLERIEEALRRMEQALCSL
ncbi:MAG: pyridoxal phosphate-dependent aminotransferase [Candidatus Bipolaricaulia bacterium]